MKNKALKDKWQSIVPAKFSSWNRHLEGAGDSIKLNVGFPFGADITEVMDGESTKPHLLCRFCASGFAPKDKDHWKGLAQKGTALTPREYIVLLNTRTEKVVCESCGDPPYMWSTRFWFETADGEIIWQDYEDNYRNERGELVVPQDTIDGDTIFVKADQAE